MNTIQEVHEAVTSDPILMDILRGGYGGAPTTVQGLCAIVRAHLWLEDNWVTQYGCEWVARDLGIEVA